jgi:uncharacterized protein (DUF433 family)
MAAKSAPFTLRLSPSLDALVTEEARRTQRSKGAIVEALAEEAARTRLFPGIAFRGTDWDRRPWVIGTALDVWEIIRAYQDFDSFERMLEESYLTEAQLRLALAYYQRFPEEIDAIIADDRRSLDELREAFPTIEVLTVSIE